MRSEMALVVEDDSGMRGLLANWLRDADFEPVTAPTAEEAVRHLQRTPFALALCDVGLPGRDGLWLAEAIRDHSSETAVIFATGRRDPVVRAAVARSLALDCLLKPFHSDRLRQALETARGWRSANDRRAAVRRTRERRAAIRLAGGAGSMPAARLQSGHRLLVENISLGGALVISPTRLFPGAEVSIIFAAPEWADHTRARVARCDVASVTPDGIRYRAGLQFVTPAAPRLP